MVYGGRATVQEQWHTHGFFVAKQGPGAPGVASSCLLPVAFSVSYVAHSRNFRETNPNLRLHHALCGLKHCYSRTKRWGAHFDKTGPLSRRAGTVRFIQSPFVNRQSPIPAIPRHAVRLTRRNGAGAVPQTAETESAEREIVGQFAERQPAALSQ